MRGTALGGIVIGFVALLAGPARAAGDRALRFTCPARFVEGIPVPVRIEVLAGGSPDRSIWRGSVALSIEGPDATVAPAEIALHNGWGSGLLAVAGTGDVTLAASFADLGASVALRKADPSRRREVAGALDPGVTEWGPADGTIAVTGDVTVPDGATLRLLADTLVLLDPKRKITVHGTVESVGTREAPILFTASDPERPWGEIRHEDDAEPSSYRFTMFTRGGDSPGAGHTGRGPVVRPISSSIVFEDCDIADNHGKGIYARGADLVFRRCVFARSAMGMEVVDTAIAIEASAFLEMFPGGDVGDNDALYLHGRGAMTVRSTIFASGGDEGIDTLESRPLIEDCWIHDFEDKGISVYGGATRVERCLIADCAVGITAKGFAPQEGNPRETETRVDRTTIADCPLGLWIRDKYGVPDAIIRLFVRNTIVWGADETLRTDYAPEMIDIAYSDLAGEVPYPGEGNIIADPRFIDPEAGEYGLGEGSPCIDAGDPAADPDPDGSRADLGAIPYEQSAEPAFIRGYTNADGTRDIGDAVTILQYLFAGGDLGCLEAADLNDDGALDLADPIVLLAFLFADGPPPAEPAEACAPDPTPDGLGCASAPACEGG